MPSSIVFFKLVIYLNNTYKIAPIFIQFETSVTKLSNLTIGKVRKTA